MATDMKDVMTDGMRQMGDSMTSAIKTAMKFQEETFKFWNDTFTKNMGEVRGQMDRATEEFAPFTKKNADRFSRMFEEQTQKNLDMMRQSCDMFGCMTMPTENVERFATVGKNAVEMFRGSADAMAKANMDMWNGWNDMMRSACSNMNGKPAAAKVAAK